MMTAHFTVFLGCLASVRGIFLVGLLESRCHAGGIGARIRCRGKQRVLFCKGRFPVVGFQFVIVSLAESF